MRLGATLATRAAERYGRGGRKWRRPHDWKRVWVEHDGTETDMQWYGEYLWRADWPTGVDAGASYRVCATDAAGNTACGAPR